jgi:hypothetical protein
MREFVRSRTAASDALPSERQSLTSLTGVCHCDGIQTNVVPLGSTRTISLLPMLIIDPHHDHEPPPRDAGFGM